MHRAGSPGRASSGEAGYSLAELLVVCAVTGLVMAAVVGVFDMSQRMYTRASSLEDAQGVARVGLDRMTRELAMIGSYYRGATSAGDAITAAAVTSITFVGDVDADTAASGSDTVTSAAAAGTTVTLGATTAGSFAASELVYIADGANREVRQITSVAGATLTLGAALSRTYPAGSIARSVETVTYAYDPVAGSLTRTAGGVVDTIVTGVVGMTLTYFDGSNPPVTTTDRTQMREIGVSLTTQGTDGSRRVMATRVRPRSLAL